MSNGQIHTRIPWLKRVTESKEHNCASLSSAKHLVRVEFFASEIPGNDKNHPNHPVNNNLYPFVCDPESKAWLLPIGSLRNQSVMTTAVEQHELDKRAAMVAKTYEPEICKWHGEAELLRLRNNYVRSYQLQGTYSSTRKPSDMRHAREDGGYVLMDRVERNGIEIDVRVLNINESIELLVDGYNIDEHGRNVRECWGEMRKKGFSLSGAAAHEFCLIGSKHDKQNKNVVLARVTILETNEVATLYVSTEPTVTPPSIGFTDFTEDRKPSPRNSNNTSPFSPPPVDEIMVESNPSFGSPPRVARRPTQGFGTPTTVGTTVTNPPPVMSPKLTVMNKLSDAVRNQQALQSQMMESDDQMVSAQEKQNSASAKVLSEGNKNLAEHTKSLQAQNRANAQVLAEGNKNLEEIRKDRAASRKRQLEQGAQLSNTLASLNEELANMDEYGNPLPPKKKQKSKGFFGGFL